VINDAVTGFDDVESCFENPDQLRCDR